MVAHAATINLIDVHLGANISLVLLQQPFKRNGPVMVLVAVFAMRWLLKRKGLANGNNLLSLCSCFLIGMGL